MSELKLGFGCMRFLQENGAVIESEVKKMFDLFLENGFTYFDTAHGYLNGQSEPVIRRCLVDRYPREKFVLTDKLSAFLYKKEEEIIPYIENQLKICGVSYFDNYLIHSVHHGNYEKYKNTHAFELVKQMKEQGKIKHIGISFHDNAELLEQILTEQPEIELVQIQLNYLDFDDPGVQSRRLLETCRKFNKKVIVMEPIRGGRLAELPEKIHEKLAQEISGTDAALALRFAAQQEGVVMVLSGMNTLDTVRENTALFKDIQPLSEKEEALAFEAARELHALSEISCTACAYCTNVCPQELKIPDFFQCYNEKKMFGGSGPGKTYRFITGKSKKASECLSCGACEGVCPQQIEIREMLKKVAAAFETEEA